MRKKDREKAKAVKAAKKQSRKSGGPFTVFVQLSCGCCQEDLHFNSKKSAEEALACLGLTMDGVVTDDHGKTVSGIDTFYGFTEDAEELKTRPLNVLAKRVGLL